MQKLIILRGPMGSGKTSIGLRYKSFENKFAHLQVDVFKNIFNHFEKEARPVVYGAVVATLNNLLEQGFSVVLEGVLQDPLTIDRAIEVAEKHGVAWRVFNLIAPLETLVQRDSSRSEIKSGLRQPLGREAIAHIKNKLEEKYHLQSINIDTENMAISQIVAFIDQEFSTNK